MNDDSGPSHADAETAPAGSGMRPRGDEDLSADTVRALHAELTAIARALPERIEADPEKVEQGLAKLVLTLIEVLRKVLEHQAVRRMEGGSLTDAEVERLGLTLLRLNDRMEELKGVFGLKDDDLSIDLGPLGRVR